MITMIAGLASVIVLMFAYGLVKRYLGVEISARVITAMVVGVALVAAVASGAPQDIVGHLAPTLEVLATGGTT